MPCRPPSIRSPYGIFHHRLGPPFSWTYRPIRKENMDQRVNSNLKKQACSSTSTALNSGASSHTLLSQPTLLSPPVFQPVEQIALNVHDASIRFTCQFCSFRRLDQLPVLLPERRPVQRKRHSLFFITRQSLLPTRMAMPQQWIVLSQQCQLLGTVHLLRSELEVSQLSQYLHPQYELQFERQRVLACSSIIALMIE